jgi:Zn-dependent protease
MLTYVKKVLFLRSVFMLFAGLSLYSLLLSFPVIIISLTFHEFSHAYVSYRLGDPTAKNLGRLTLNPLKHLELFGTLMMLIARVGWAKPVPINPMYYRDRRKGTMLVSLAGPLSNILLALIFAFPMYYLEYKYYVPKGISQVLYDLCYLFYILNLNLAVFNIIPVPPLDGSKIMAGVLPSRQYFKMLEYQNYFMIGFLILVFIFPGALSFILRPLINLVSIAIGTIVRPILGIFL